MEILIIVSVVIIVIVLFLFFLYLLKIKIEILEVKIMKLFKSRTNIIPALYDVTEDYLIKHDKIFEEIFKLRRREFNSFSFQGSIEEMLYLESSIHHELDFILSISEKNNKIMKNGKFLYIKDTILERSLEIGSRIKLYKAIVVKYNFLISIKNLTIIGLLFLPKLKDDLKNIRAN